MLLTDHKIPLLQSLRHWMFWCFTTKLRALLYHTSTKKVAESFWELLQIWEHCEISPIQCFYCWIFLWIYLIIQNWERSKILLLQSLYYWIFCWFYDNKKWFEILLLESFYWTILSQNWLRVIWFPTTRKLLLINFRIFTTKLRELWNSTTRKLLLKIFENITYSGSARPFSSVLCNLVEGNWIHGCKSRISTFKIDGCYLPSKNGWFV